jgi:hypothetical protein
MVSLPPVGGIADIVVVLREKSQLTRPPARYRGGDRRAPASASRFTWRQFFLTTRFKLTYVSTGGGMEGLIHV